MEALRFLMVSAAGVVLDLAISFSTAELFGLPLWIAAAIGFLVAAAANYVAHELWTFRSGAYQLSARRGVQYVGVSALTLLSRLVVVAWLSSWIERDYALAILICGAGVSFFVNFTISKFLVFAKGSTRDN